MKTIDSEREISALILNDEWMMKVLHAAEVLNLKDWWIGAGFLRNKIWDYLEERQSQPTRDVDLVYFDAGDVSPDTDWAYDEQMKAAHPYAEWEIRNQARMHYMNDFAPFTSTADGIAHWVETATCIGVRLKDNQLLYLFCHGTKDVFGLVARPTSFFAGQDMIHKFYDRVDSKGWQKRWPNLKIEADLLRS